MYAIRSYYVVFPYIKFNNSEANKVLEKFKNLVISAEPGGMKDVFKNLKFDSFGVPLVYGKGGLHGSFRITSYNVCYTKLLR